jgi:hypothetical protein
MASFSDFYRRAARQLTEFKNGRDEKSITPELLDYKSGKPGAAMFDIERQLQARIDHMNQVIDAHLDVLMSNKNDRNV